MNERKGTCSYIAQNMFFLIGEEYNFVVPRSKNLYCWNSNMFELNMQFHPQF